MSFGSPRLHVRQIDSTNLRARELADAGAPHGTLVTAHEQLAGRGRQGRAWSAAPGSSLLMSLVLHDPPALLSLIAGLAVAESVDTVLRAAGRHRASAAQIKWPNDVLVDARKISGILVEARPQAGWAVLGIGVNVAVALSALPPELAGRAGTLGLSSEAIEPTLAVLLDTLARLLAEPEAAVLDAIRARDALAGQQVSWAGGGSAGTAAGIDTAGRLLVREANTGHTRALEAGEVHLSRLAR